MFSCSTSSFISFIVLLKFISFINYNNGCAVRAAPVIKYWLLLRYALRVVALIALLLLELDALSNLTRGVTNCCARLAPSIMLAAANAAKAIDFVTAVYE